MSALPKHYTFQEHGVEWLSPNVAISEFTGDMAFERVGVQSPAYLANNNVFNRLPDCIAALSISPLAKLVYADIFSWVFSTKDGELDHREYFFSYSSMADRVYAHRSHIPGAIAELIEAKLVTSDVATRSTRKRVKLIPVNTEVTRQGTSEDHKEQGFDDVEDLKDSTTEPGKPMPFAVARHLRMTPIYLNLMRCRYAGVIRTVDVTVYGAISKLASPFIFNNKARIAGLVGVSRTTIYASLKRLMRIRLLAEASQGYYVVAHPLMYTTDNTIQQTNYLMKLVKQEEENV